jgi:hypothetical protein
VICLKILTSAQLLFAFSTLEFCLVYFFFSTTHMASIDLHSIGQYLLYLMSSIFSWVLGAACFLCLVWGQGILPTSCIRSPTNVSLNILCDNFAPHVAKMIQLLRMVRLRRRKNSFFDSKSIC